MLNFLHLEIAIIGQSMQTN